MSGPPKATAIARHGRGVRPADERTPPPLASWDEVADSFRRGGVGPFWLSTTRPDGAPHVRPVFAAWAGSSFFFASKDAAAKTAHLRRNPRATIAVALEGLHVIVEGGARRVVEDDRLRLAREAMQDVFQWPTRIAGKELDADYGAPTSGGPPYQIYELLPSRAYAFPMHNQTQPTRWTWPAGAEDGDLRT